VLNASVNPVVLWCEDCHSYFVSDEGLNPLTKG